MAEQQRLAKKVSKAQQAAKSSAKYGETDNPYTPPNRYYTFHDDDDPYNTQAYHTPEDFYAENSWDFDGPDDAEDDWHDHHS